HVGEVALAEEQLPYAFYGLTYLPVMALLTGLASWARLRGRSRFGATEARLRGALLLERPARIASLIVSIGMLALSVTHEKAILPVAAAMILVLSVQTVVYRLRWLGLLVVAAVILAVTGVAPFSAGVLGRAISGNGTMALYAGVAGILLALSGRVDRWLDGLKPSTGAWRILARASAVTTGALAIGWVLIYGTATATATIFTFGCIGLPLIIGALLVVHTLRWRHPAAAASTIAFGYLVVVITLLTAGATAAVVLTAITVLALTQWGISYGLDRRPDGLISRAFAPAALWTSSVLLFGLLLLVHLPNAIADMIALPVEATVDVPWILRLASVAWAFDAARRIRNKTFGALGMVSLLALFGAVFISTVGIDAWRWLPMVWVVSCAAALPVLRLLRRRAAAASVPETYDAITVPLDIGLRVVFFATAVVTLPIWSFPLRVAGLAAVGGLWITAGSTSVLRRAAVVLAQWQIVSTVFYLLTSPELTNVLGVTWPAIAPVLLPAALVATILRIVVPMLWPEPQHSDLLAVNRWGMSVFTVLAVLCSLGLEALTLVDGIAAGLTLALLVFEQLYEGCSARRAANVWIGQIVAGLAVAYFAWFGIIHLGRGLSMFIVMAVGVVLWVVATLAERHPKTEVMAKPFFTTAMILPAVTVCIGLARHVVFHRPGWLGLNSLGLLLAGGFYFWQGIERRRSSLLVLAAGILNISVMLLWRELSWSDPQFYMIPIGITLLALTRLLEREIPVSLHDPLYYLGALVILVSPTFNIVSGSWMHLLSLMVSSTAMVFVAIGLRLRALVYAGAAFLVADLVAIVVRGSVDHPSVLWLAGLALGAAVIVVGAVAERNRERLLQRIRLLSAELQSWS
ncbi:MAG: hypothetical protein V3T05_10105, partial [Myxococcota bacterium]